MTIIFCKGVIIVFKYLINKNKWLHEKDELLERAGMTDFANSKFLLQNLEKLTGVHRRYHAH